MQIDVTAIALKDLEWCLGRGRIGLSCSISLTIQTLEEDGELSTKIVSQELSKIN